MWRILIILVLAVLANGCGGDGSGGGDDAGGETTPGTESAPAAPTLSVAEGCTPQQPLERTLPPRYAVLVDACAAEDGTSLSLTNVSSAVLQVWSLGPTEPDLDVEPPDEDSLSVDAIGMAVEGYTVDHGVLVAPDARVVASANESFTLDVRVVGNVTVSAYAAKALAEWVDGKLKTRDERLAYGVSKCAQNVATVYKTGSGGTWQQALGEAVASVPNCKSLVQEVNDTATAPPKLPVSTADDIKGVARRVSSSGWDEALKLAGRVIKVAAS